MAHETYLIDLEKQCPRCGSIKAIVSVLHFGATHQPSCNGCGLMNAKGDAKELAKTIITNCFYEYEEKQKSLNEKTGSHCI